MEVSTDLHTEELMKGFVLEDSADRHVKQLELCSGGIWSIHCYAKKTSSVFPSLSSGALSTISGEGTPMASLAARSSMMSSSYLLADRY